MNEATCSLAGCSRKHHARGWCKLHWKRWRRTGSALGDETYRRTPSEVEAQFRSRILESGGCWLWTGKIDRGGYGQFWADGALHRAHVWAYKHWMGQIPEGLVLDHVEMRGCTHRNCVNPNHLEAVTPRENVLRGRRTKISDADARKAWQRCRDGASQADIAKELGVTQSALSYRFKKLQLKP